MIYVRKGDRGHDLCLTMCLWFIKTRPCNSVMHIRPARDRMIEATLLGDVGIVAVILDENSLIFSDTQTSTYQANLPQFIPLSYS